MADPKPWEKDWSKESAPGAAPAVDPNKKPWEQNWTADGSPGTGGRFGGGGGAQKDEPAEKGRSGFTLLTDPLEGIGAGAISTVAHTGDILSHFVPGMKKPTENPTMKRLMTPPNTFAGKAGFFGEQIAEMTLLPEASEAQLLKLGKGSKLAAGAFGSLQEGARMGATEYVQTGGDSKAALTAAVTAGGISGFGKALGPLLEKTGRHIQASTIRPRLSDVKDGFKWETLDKYKLTGNLEQSFNQVDSKLNELRSARNALIAPGKANVDLRKAFGDALTDVTHESKSLEYGHMGAKAEDQVKSIMKEVEDLVSPGKGLVGPTGAPLPKSLSVDISKAENLKEFMGTLGSWSYGRGDPDAKVTELVANTVYAKLKTAIEQALGPEGAKVQALNKQMQELIPVKHAMLARLPVEERNRMFSLADVMAALPAVVTGNAADLALLGMTRGQKSLRLGNALVRHGGKAPQVVKPLGRGAAELLTRDPNPE